jgi:hypothetical protein
MLQLISFYRDSETIIFTVITEKDKIGLLQAFFEAYDGVALIRTVEEKSNLVEIISTPSMEDDCRIILKKIDFT